MSFYQYDSHSESLGRLVFPFHATVFFVWWITQTVQKYACQVDQETLNYPQE